MSISDVTVRREVRVSALVSGEGPVPMMHSSVGAMMEPITIYVSYDWIDGGPWTTGSIVITGDRLKKDGTPGRATVRNVYYQIGRRRGFDIAPAWAVKFANDNMPGSD